MVMVWSLNLIIEKTNEESCRVSHGIAIRKDYFEAQGNSRVLW